MLATKKVIWTISLANGLRTSRWDVRVEPDGGENSDDVISFPTEPNYINEVVLDGDAFLRVGLNSAVVRVAPTGAPRDGCTQRVDYVIYEETQGQETENRLMVGEDTYAVGEEVELEAGVHGFVFMLVCEKSVRCVPSVSVNDINVGITGNGSLGGGWRAFSGRLEAQEPAAGKLTFLIIGDDMSMEYAFPLRIRKEGGGGGTDVEVTFERNGAVYAQLAGPTAALEFPVHLSVAVYLQGVIPYTEAIEVAGGHYDRECYEYVDVESIGMAFDVAAGETFAKREIYSSSYFRYIPDYLSKELKKISAAHTSTRWVEENGTWRKETYRPVPYLLAKIVYGDMRKSGGAYPDYFEIVYNDKQVRTFLGGYGVKVKSYVAAK